MSQQSWAEKKTQRTPGAWGFLLLLVWMKTLLEGWKKKRRRKNSWNMRWVIAITKLYTRKTALLQSHREKVRHSTMCLSTTEGVGITVFFTCWCLLCVSGWSGLAQFGGQLLGRCRFGSHWCDTWWVFSWSLGWRGWRDWDFLAGLQLLLQPLHLLLHLPQLLWRRKNA